MRIASAAWPPVASRPVCSVDEPPHSPQPHGLYRLGAGVRRTGNGDLRATRPSPVGDVIRSQDIEQKPRCSGHISHHPDAERDLAWLLDRLAERNARITELEAGVEAGAL